MQECPDLWSCFRNLVKLRSWAQEGVSSGELVDRVLTLGPEHSLAQGAG